MATLELSDEEVKILAILLEQAADEFGNHGCNDFDVAAELGLSKEEASVVGKRVYQQMVASKTADPEMLNSSGQYLLDWQLFRHFEKRVRSLLEFPKATTEHRIEGTNVILVQPVGNCDGSGLYAYDPNDEDGRGAKLPTKCPGCRACS